MIFQTHPIRSINNQHTDKIPFSSPELAKTWHSRIKILASELVQECRQHKEYGFFSTNVFVELASVHLGSTQCFREALAAEGKLRKSKFLELFRQLSGQFPKQIQKCSGHYPEQIRKCSGNVPEMFRKYYGCFPETKTQYSGNVPDVFWKC